MTFGGIHQRLGGQQRQLAHSQHGLRAVDQRHRLFRFQHQRLDLGLLENAGTGDARALCVEAFAFADQRQRQVRERRKVPAGAHAALRRDHRSDAAVEHLAESVDQHRAHARVPLGEGVGPQQHHGARLWDRERLADADRMGAHQIQLQLADLVAGDADVAQSADASGYRIGNFIVRYERVHYGAGAVDGLARVGVEEHGPVLDRHFARTFERQIVTVDVQGFQSSSRFSVLSSQFSVSVLSAGRSLFAVRCSSFAVRRSLIVVR